MSITILRAKDVDEITSQISSIEFTNLMRGVFVANSSNGPEVVRQSPHRNSTQTPLHTTLFMPSRFGTNSSLTSAPPTTAIKIVSVPRHSDSQRGLPATTVIMDEETGGVRGIINARTLTAIRTAAGSALATLVSLGDGLKEVKELVMFGAGLQIYWHVRLLLGLILQGDKAEGDQISESHVKVTIVNRRKNERLEALVGKLKAEFGSQNVAVESYVSAGTREGQDDRNLKAILEKADVICTATSSKVPLFPSSFIPSRRRVHINLIGSYTPEMREIDDDLVKRAVMVLVDSRESCMIEAGELIGAGLSAEDMIELGIAVIMQERGEDEDMPTTVISIFKSVGIGAQDVAIGELILRKAEELDLGVRIPDYDKVC